MKLPHLHLDHKSDEIEWSRPKPKRQSKKPTTESRQVTELREKISTLESQLKIASDTAVQREESIRKELKEMSWLFKVIDGQEFDPDSKIEFMTDIQYIGERSRFNRQDIIRQNYLRLIALFHPELYAFRDWANFDAAHLISQDGGSRAEFVDIKKGNQHPGQVFQIGTVPEKAANHVEAKRGFLDRFRKREKAEAE